MTYLKALRAKIEGIVKIDIGLSIFILLVFVILMILTFWDTTTGLLIHDRFSVMDLENVTVIYLSLRIYTGGYPSH